TLTKIVPYGVPSIIGLEKIDENEETFEVLAYAFYLASKKYFEEKNRIEDDIADVRSQMKSVKRYYWFTGLVIFISIATAFALSNFYITMFSVAGFIGSVIVYIRLKKLNEECNQLMNQWESLKIDNKVTFVSKLYLPVYILPYKNGVMIFDALGLMPSNTFSIYNLPGDQLYQKFIELREKTKMFDQSIADKSILSVEELTKYDQNILTSKILEEPILKTLEDINNLSENLQKNDITIQVYGPQTEFAKSIQNIFAKNIQRIMEQEDIPTVAVKFTLEDAIQTIEFIRGVKTSAIAEDIVDACNRWKQEIVCNEVLNEIKSALIENVEFSNELFNGLGETIRSNINYYVCPECAKSNIEKIGPEYKLVKTFMDYLNAASEGFKVLEDKENMERFYERLRNIAEEIKLDLPEEIIPGLFDCSSMKIDISGETYRCQKHGDITDYTEVPKFTNVFAFVASRIFEELRKPIRDVLKKASQEINQLYLTTKSQKLALIPLEEILTQLKIKSKELETAIREAEIALSNL
ncbi:MAG: hypothetical protein QXX41_06360, partial [Nitrososphaerota archaeon]